MRLLILNAILTASLCGAPLSYDSRPMGTEESPLILRTYTPDPGLADEVLPRHGKGDKSPKYNVGKGQDSKGEFSPIDGIPAAIAVNHGPALSYVFDTVECRMLYAWQGGFLDMFPYWGETKSGRRRDFDYVPRLVGNLFMVAEGGHPLSVAGKPISDDTDLEFVGYDLDKKGFPTFRFKVGMHEIIQEIEAVKDAPTTCRLRFTSTSNVRLDYRASAGEKVSRDGTSLIVEITGSVISKHHGFERNMKLKGVSAENGEKVFTAYGCIACHSTDGSVGHGPSLMNLHGQQREIEGSDELIIADDEYIRESILKPNAKTAKGFPPNYMPPYPLKKDELESLLLYIRSLSGE